MKEAAQTASKKALQTAASKTGEYAGKKKAGDKIIQILSKKNKTSKSDDRVAEVDRMNRVNKLIKGGKMRKFM